MPGVFQPWTPANGSFEYLDASVLYAMLRWSRPKRVIELGAGFSTIVASRALQQNRRDGSASTMCSYDPWPPPLLLSDLRSATDLRETSASALTVGMAAELEAGDVLLIDTTHTVKVGGEVTHLLLDILPTLAEGVLVHIHDIFLPWEYPEHWHKELGYFWAEQYLVRALLIDSSGFDVVLAMHWMHRVHPELLPRPASGRPSSPSSLWLRRRGHE
jgi:hypothetical protein